MAEDVFAALTDAGHDVSLATVYNTLGRFVAAGLLRTVQRAGEGLRYDPNTAPHHHFFDVDTGRIHDIDVETVQVMVDGDRLGSATVDRVAVFIEGRGAPAPMNTPV
jgi:Fur family iron response transcriptional regulator